MHCLGIIRRRCDYMQLPNWQNTGWLFGWWQQQRTWINGVLLQAGLRQAKILLADSAADNKIIVLLSDGVPTYSSDCSMNTWNSGVNGFVTF